MLARREAFVRCPVQGNVLEALDDGPPRDRREHAVRARLLDHDRRRGAVTIGEGCFLNIGMMVAAKELVEIGDH